MTNPFQIQQNILKQYQQLPESERLIVQFCALLNVNNHGNSLIPFLKPLRSAKPLTDLMVKNLKRTEIIDNQCRCHPIIRHQATIDALANAQATKLIECVQNYLSRNNHSTTEYFLRLAIYLNDQKNFNVIVEKIQAYNAPSLEKFIQNIFANQLIELNWLKSRLVILQKLLLQTKLTTYWLTGTVTADVKSWLPYYQTLPIVQKLLPYQTLLTTHDIYTANFSHASQRLNCIAELSAMDYANRATLNFLIQETASQALTDFNHALKLYRKEQQRRKVFLPGINGFFFLLAHIGENSPTALYPLIELAQIAAADHYPQIHQQGFAAITACLNILQGEHKVADMILNKLYESQESLDPLSFVMYAYVQYWQEKTKLKFSTLEEQFLRIKTSLPLIALLLAEMMEAVKPGSSDHFADQYPHIRKILPLFTQLGSSVETKMTPTFDMGKHRVVWLVNPDKKTLHARIQTRNARGSWNQGKRIAWAELANYKSTTDLKKLLHPIDEQIINLIDFAATQEKADYIVKNNKTWLSFANHPRVFHSENPSQLIQFIIQKPELLVEKFIDHYHIQLSHQNDTAAVLLEKETSARYRVIEFTPEHLQLQTALVKNDGKIPNNKLADLLPELHNIAQTYLPPSAADSTLHVLLIPWQHGLKINLVIKPVPNYSDYYQPGKGRALLIANSDGIKQQLRRDLAKEQIDANLFIAACPHLTNHRPINNEWSFADSQTCLEILDELQNYIAQQSTQTENPPIVLEWPEGQTFKISRALSFNDLTLQVNQWQQWFEIKGELTIDEHQVINLQHLLKQIAETPSRFIPIGNKQFLSLTQHFKNRLQELAKLTINDADRTTFHNLAAPALQDFFSDVIHLHTDKHWHDLLQRLEKIRQHQPTIPATLQAQLRDYQVDGYLWLSRLAYWGVGACLADDMGLGKTLQALALALEQADKGPILIIAPTSVCYNWQLEMQRFTPTLAIKLFDSQNKANRIDNLKAQDALICSYHILQQDIEYLARIKWQLIILDEGQAIKNFSTKRAQAAFQLQAHARIILSGTPIENHLGELWSLFRFLNPGLLGSREDFQNRFIAPIERDKDNNASIALKRLVQPFILRRNKGDVLTALPPRIDQTLYIDPSEEEIVFYEALRRQALENINDLKNANPGRRQLHILAEITRLKRACCHPSLAEATSQVTSSKLTAFFELLEELRENKHRALVFSQYVGFLKILQRELDAQHIQYQYLDGQTPVAKRQQQINEFQNGKSELFLISLKAGGMGLNLTAADYVIHLDPWWNPAVEDQASDRAHRIGQTRPVTIYRLIVRNTIEEKILNMHQNKRNLANDLLSGSELVSKLSEEELLKLIKS